MTRILDWRKLAAASVFALTLATAANAADVNARIRGTVTDPTGALIPNVAVVATNQNTGVRFTTTSSASGDYSFQALPIGTYSISATAPGFKSFSATGITLSIDQEYDEPVKLALGSSGEVVEVQADSVQVNTTDMQLNNIVDAKQIVELPLLGRDFTQLELTLPGVQASNDRFGTFSVNGSETQQVSYLVNGADTNDFAINTLGLRPSVDAINEFNLITGPLNAEYSRNSGAIVSTAVKSGTNQIHGDIFEFYRDTFLNTAGFFNYRMTTGANGVVTSSKPTPKYHQNLFGATIGLPIWKDKLFFFGSYQGNRARAPQDTNTITVLTDAQRKGIFTGTTLSAHKIPGAIVVPGCVSNTGGNDPNADTFASCSKKNGGDFSGAFNPISAVLLAKYIPAANVGTNGFVFNPSTNTVQDQAIARIDFNPTTKDQLAFLGIYQHQPVSDSLPFTGPNLPGFGDVNTSEVRQFTFNYIRQLSPTALNSFSLHYTRFNLGGVTPANIVAPSTEGFAISPQNTAGQSLPLISLGGTRAAIGFSTNGPQPRIDQTYQADEAFSKNIGHHVLKFGYDGRRFNVDNEFSAANNGSYTFSNTSSGNPNTSGSRFLDFLIGNPASYNQGAGGRISAYAYEHYVYGQDTWKATQDLTIDLGIGYQIDTAIHNRQYGGVGVNCFIAGQQSKIFPTAPLSLNFPGDPGCNDAQGATIPYKDFGPRLGFAYSPDFGFLSAGNSHKLSIRGGFGIYYNRTEEEGSLQNLSQAPFGISSAGIRDSQKLPTDRPSFGNPYQNVNTGATIANPFPASFPKPGATNVKFPNNALYLSQYQPGYRAPYAENFQLSVEREFPSKIIGIASYVGSLGRHNQLTVEGNPVTQAGHDACLADPVCVGSQDDQEILYPSHTLYPQQINPAIGSTNFYSASMIATGGASSYHSLQLSMKKAETHGLAGQVSYTFSHALDNVSSYEGGGFGGARGYNQYNNRTNYGNADFDARHRLVISPIYAIPKLAGSQLSFKNLLLSGWEISTITTFATGHPYDVSYQGGVSYSLYCSANDFYYTCPDVPNQVAPVKRLDPRNPATRGQYIDGSFNNFQNGAADIAGASFADEATGTFGNIARNKFYGPGLQNTDGQLSKNFNYSKDNAARTIQLRLESFDVFNHTNFHNPGGNPATGTLGVITAADGARRFQLSGKLYF